MHIKQKKMISLEDLVELDKQRTAEEKAEIAAVAKSPARDKFIKEKELDPNNEKDYRDKYYLPVLNINHAPEWESKPVDQRKHFTDEVAMNTCLGNCCGVPGLKGGCCHLDPVDMEHVLGPLDEEWIKDIVKWFRKKGMNFSRQDIVIDYEEGVVIGDTLFKDAPNNAVFRDKKAYPFLRFQVLGPRYVCKFMNPTTYKCQIYEVRPKMCREYLCQYVVSNFLVKTKNKPNTWQKAR
jgi:Fe-S-cluster containining protein